MIAYRPMNFNRRSWLRWGLLETCSAKRSLAFLAVFGIAAASTSGVSADLPVVVIDIGHSRVSPGAISARGTPEFEFNVRLAAKIKLSLEAAGYSVSTVGADGALSNLGERVTVLSRLKPMFLISVHHDSVQQQILKRWQWQGRPSFYTDAVAGFSLFVSRRNLYPSDSLRCASAIGLSLQGIGFHASEHHAALIAGENRKWADRDHGVYYYDDLAVLKAARSPAVLLEAGVIVNPDEELRLWDESVRGAIAGAVARGITGCGLVMRRNN
jgi:N-acetylmuramoyl-L-alanine amidase